MNAFLERGVAQKRDEIAAGRRIRPEAMLSERCAALSLVTDRANFGTGPASGFLYLVSVTGVTGTRSATSNALVGPLRRSES